MKDKIIEILKQAYLWGRDNGEGRSEKNFNDFLETSTFKDFIDSLYPTLNRDKVMEIVRGKCISDKAAEVATDDICSLSLPTQKRKDPVDPLDSYYLKDGKWHCVECDKPMNLPTLSEGEYTKIGKPDDCDVESCVGPDCEGCQRFQPKLITNTLSEEEIEKMAEKNSYFWMSDSKRIVAKQAYKEGFKAALEELTKPKEEKR
jgi:hypothetical protein